MYSIFALVLGSFAIYGLTLALVLFMKENKLRKANRALGGLVLALAIILFQGAINQLEDLEIAIQWQLILSSVWFLIPPLIYLHAYYTLYPDQKRSKWEVLHLLPLLLHLLNVTPFFVMLDQEQQMEWINSGAERNDLLYLLLSNGLLLLIQYLVYIPWSFYTISKYLNANRKHLQEDSHKRVISLRNAYFILTIFILLMEVFRFLQVPGAWTTIFLLGLAGVIFSLAFVAMYKPNFLFNRIGFQLRFRSHELPRIELEAYQQVLQHALDQQLFRDPKLNIDILAKHVGLSPRQLRSLIKKSYHLSFSDFINTQRVEAAQQLLRDPAYAHYSILAIGLEVGFNSKTTFNRVFKHKTGQTPSQYLAAHQRQRKVNHQK